MQWINLEGSQEAVELWSRLLKYIVKHKPIKSLENGNELLLFLTYQILKTKLPYTPIMESKHASKIIFYMCLRAKLDKQNKD